MIGLRGYGKFGGKAEIGYWLGKKYWRQGIMGRALRALIKFSFKS